MLEAAILASSPQRTRPLCFPCVRSTQRETAREGIDASMSITICRVVLNLINNFLYSFSHAISAALKIDAHSAPLKSIVFMEDAKSLMSCSIDKTIKLWALAAAPVEPRTIQTDGPVQHMCLNTNVLFYANDVIPGGAPSGDAVGIVQMLNLGSNVQTKCLVRRYL